MTVTKITLSDFIKLVYRLPEHKPDGQKIHVATANLIKTLQNMNAVNLHDIEYMALYKGSKTLDALTKLSGNPLVIRVFGLSAVKVGIIQHSSCFFNYFSKKLLHKHS